MWAGEAKSQPFWAFLGKTPLSLGPGVAARLETNEPRTSREVRGFVLRVRRGYSITIARTVRRFAPCVSRTR
jgi:hypothetical protein